MASGQEEPSGSRGAPSDSRFFARTPPLQIAVGRGYPRPCWFRFSAGVRSWSYVFAVLATAPLGPVRHSQDLNQLPRPLTIRVRSRLPPDRYLKSLSIWAIFLLISQGALLIAVPARGLRSGFPIASNFRVLEISSCDGFQDAGIDSIADRLAGEPPGRRHKLLSS